MVKISREDVETWTERDVSRWMENQGLRAASKDFLKQQVTGKVLLEGMDVETINQLESLSQVEKSFLLSWIENVKNGEDVPSATSDVSKGDPTKAADEVGGGDVNIITMDDVYEGKVRIEDMKLDQLRAMMPHWEDSKVEEFKSNLDFNQFEFDYKTQRAGYITAMLEIFKDQVISVIIAQYAMNLFDGEWYTTNQVFLYQNEKNELIGWFQQYLLLGRVFNDEILFHQYCHGKEAVTLFCTVDESHNKLVGHYFSGKGLAEKQRQPIEFLRGASPYVYAFQAIQNGDDEFVAELRSKFKLDINNQPEPSGDTMLHQAVRANQLSTVRYLMGANAKTDIKNAFGQTALDVAVQLGLEDVKKEFPGFNKKFGAVARDAMKSEEADVPEAGGSAIPDAYSPRAQDNQVQLPEISIDDDVKSESEANCKIDETLEAVSIKSNETVRMTTRVVEEMNEVLRKML